MTWLVYAELAFAALCCACVFYICCRKPTGIHSETLPLMQSNPTTSGSMEQAKPRPSRASKAFILARHPAQGLLLLKAFKKRKGLHHQLPGGRVDEGDESAAAGAARELLEETGIDVCGTLGRLRPVLVGCKGLGSRAFFTMDLEDRDLATLQAYFSAGRTDEHTGYDFVQDLLHAADMVRLHSGGKSKTAVELYAAELVCS